MNYSFFRTLALIVWYGAGKLVGYSCEEDSDMKKSYKNFFFAHFSVGFLRNRIKRLKILYSQNSIIQIINFS